MEGVGLRRKGERVWQRWRDGRGVARWRDARGWAEEEGWKG